jgi:hypothetical protein
MPFRFSRLTWIASTVMVGAVVFKCFQDAYRNRRTKTGQITADDLKSAPPCSSDLNASASDGSVPHLLPTPASSPPEHLEGYKLVGHLPDGTAVFRPFVAPSQTVLPLTQTSVYNYKSLEPGCIRLLTIHPDIGTTYEDELLCSLSTVNIGDIHLPAYEAISYTWPPPDSRSLSRIRFAHSTAKKLEDGTWKWIYEVSSNECLCVTQAVEKILRRLRSQAALDGVWKTIWIDQLCINQQDNDERAEQVLRMGEIYARAKGVITWLGDEVEEDEMQLAFDCMNRLAKMEKWWWDDPCQAPQTIANRIPMFRPWELEGDDKEYVPLEEWSALRQMFISRAWFRRAWVLQEVVMAHTSTVLYGSSLEISWHTVEVACQVIHSMGIYMGPFDHAEKDPGYAINNVLQVCGIRATIQRQSDPQGLRLMERLLIATRNLEATNPRDIIYSKFGIARNNRPLPKPDYSADVRDAYVRIAMYWMYNWKSNLDMLNEVQLSDRDHRLPSWVPDWSLPRLSMTIAAVGNQRGFDATEHDLGNFQQHTAVTLPEIPPDGQKIPREFAPVLTVRGVKLMTVLMAQNVYGSEEGDILVPDRDRYPTTGESYAKVCALLLASGSAGDYVCRPPETRQFWEFKREFENSPKESNGQITFRIFRKRGMKEEETAQPTTLKNGRSLFISECGFMGLAPRFTVGYRKPKEMVKNEGEGTFMFSDGTRNWDVIVLLFGARTPFVLRKLENGNWRLLGECFVHGLMFGEAVRGMDEGLIEDFGLE